MKKKNLHIIKEITEGSIAEECGMEPGDAILKINGEEIQDILDYRYMIQEEELIITVLSKQGDEVEVEIEKDFDEDLGIEFENAFMDDYRSCSNKCIFCFIDQMPPGMRETLYFKDDDARLSFLQGNYVTLTNMSDADIDRIIRYHLEPINISFQTMNPQLRCKMLNNRFAGEALKKADKLFEAGITMNGQIVLCKDVNDKKELDYSIEQLMKYIPVLESVSVVPVGLSKYRDGLYPLEPFTKEDAKRVLAQIHGWQAHCIAAFGTHFVHASDEWYLLAEEELPTEEQYDGYLQLENGVGMLRLFEDEFNDAFAYIKETKNMPVLEGKRIVSVATGKSAYDMLSGLATKIMDEFPQVQVNCYPIRNDFFGDQITVAGLITGGDLMKQLQNTELGDVLLLPENMLKCNEDVFLDDITVSEVEKALQVKTDIVKSSGQAFLFKVLGFDA
ncbi:MAG: DUF512 domain-containing protein [Lachnospiraceae bacterium]|nr:DUF512 domain-containing protein [Lachnospiraceae bacterium]